MWLLNTKQCECYQPLKCKIKGSWHTWEGEVEGKAGALIISASYKM